MPYFESYSSTTILSMYCCSGYSGFKRGFTFLSCYLCFWMRLIYQRAFSSACLIFSFRSSFHAMTWACCVPTLLFFAKCCSGLVILCFWSAGGAWVGVFWSSLSFRLSLGPGVWWYGPCSFLAPLLGSILFSSHFPCFTHSSFSSDPGGKQWFLSFFQALSLLFHEVCRWGGKQVCIPSHHSLHGFCILLPAQIQPLLTC